MQRLTILSKLATTGLLIANLLVAPGTVRGASESHVEFSGGETLSSVEFTTDSPGAVQFTTQQESEQASVVAPAEALTYAASFVSQNGYPNLAAGQSYNFSVSVENAGTASWDPDVVFLGTDRPRDRIPSFVREDLVDENPSGWVAENRVEMLFDEDSGDLDGDKDGNGTIDPGEQATFSFWMSVPEELTDGAYNEYFNLVADDITWFNDLGLYWAVTVDNLPHARFVDQNAYPPELSAGATYEFWVRFENTGLLPWRDSGATPVHLGTDRLMDRIPGFLREGEEGTDAGWLKENRVNLDRDEDTGELVGDEDGNDQIDPGEVARFRFSYTVPATMESGLYQEYFRPVMDNRDWGWMEDFGVYWEITVDNIAPRPASLSVTPTVNHLTLAWTPSTEATSYKVRYGPVGGTLTVLDFPPSVTSAAIDLAGGEDYTIGVASVDAEGVSPFTSSVAHVESPAEAQARVQKEAAVVAEQERIASEERKAAEEAQKPVVTGAPAEEEAPVSDWRQFWLTLLIILGAAGLATAGYYGYEWWAESRPRIPTRPTHPTRPRPEPRREEPPKPPSAPSARW